MEKPINAHTEQIAPGIHWVGKMDQQGNLACNPYLIIEGSEALLIDPGSVLDFHQVLKNVTSLIPLEKISGIILHHQDPDLCGSVPLFEKAGLTCPIILHWRTSTIVKYYGVKNPYKLVNEENWAFQFSSGRKLRFIPAPYCHFPGSIMTFDETTGVIFTGDLFGAFSHSPGLYAERNYLEPMKSFHEHYIPSREILKPVIEKIETLPVKIIAPQHGKIIRDEILPFISSLKTLQCGTYLSALKSSYDTNEKKRDIPQILNDLLYKLSSLYSEGEVRSLFEGSPLILHKLKLRIEDFTVKKEILWNGFFNHIYKEKGLHWLMIIEPTVVHLVIQYELPLPDIFRKKLHTMENYSALQKEATATSDLDASKILQIKTAQTGVLNDNLTGLYNQRFLWSYLSDLLNERSGETFCLIYIALDNLQDLNRLHGWQAGDEALRSAAYLLKNYSKDNSGHMVFKLNTPAFAYLVEKRKDEQFMKTAQEIKAQVRDSDVFLEKTTASMGIFYSRELNEDADGNKETINSIFKNTLARLRLAQEQSNGSICDSSEFDDPDAVLHKRVLFVEPDISYIDFITPRLEQKGFHIMAAKDGQSALDTLQNWKPDVIVAEAMTPKINGFELREKVLAQSGLYRVPFILISNRKDEEYIKRAARLGITIYLKKPFSYFELEGLVQNLTH